MKTPVILILVHIITFVWCQPPHYFLLSMFADPYLLGSIKDEDISYAIDKLNPECSNFTEKLKTTSPTVCECFDLVIRNDNSTICERAHDVIENCTAPILTVFENCVTNDHKYWPSLIKNSLISIQEYLCETRGGSLIEIINPCIWRRTEDDKEKLKKYEEELKIKFKEYKNTPPFPKELCSFLSSDMRKYVSVRLDTTCYNYETKSAVLDLYDAVIAPCGEFNSIENYRNISYSYDIEF